MGCVDRARHYLRFATKWIQPMRKIAESICKVSRARVRWVRTSRPAARRQCLPNGSDNANTRIVKREEASQVSRLIFDFSCSSTNGWLVNIWLMLHLTSALLNQCACARREKTPDAKASEHVAPKQERTSSLFVLFVSPGSVRCLPCLESTESADMCV